MNVIESPTREDLVAIRGYVVRFLDGVYPRALSEHTIKRRLFSVQMLPTDDALLREIAFLRGEGYVTSEERDDPAGRPGDFPKKTIWWHTLTAKGHLLVTGEITDAHVQVM